MIASNTARFIASAIKNMTDSFGKNLRYYFSRNNYIKNNKVLDPSSMQHNTGFIIDIDGTLVHGHSPIPGATQIIEQLHQKNFPFLLLTNNCAPSEWWKAQEITKNLALSFQLQEKQVVLNYTPFKNRFKDMTQGLVLVVGREERLDTILPLPDLDKYITVEEYCSLFPQTVPLAGYTEQRKQKAKTILQARLKLEKPLQKQTIQISGVLVLTTPVHWEQSIQIILDHLSTPNGLLTTHHSYQHQPTHIPVMASFNDMFTSSAQHPLPRILMQPYLQSLKTVYRLTYKQQLKIDIYGKPHPSAFNFARKQLEEIYPQHQIDKVVMIGDNVESDIVGPSELGWDTILVKTGVSKDHHHLATVNAQHIKEGIEQYLALADGNKLQ